MTAAAHVRLTGEFARARSAPKPIDGAFIALLVYYWAIQFVRGDSVYIIDPNTSYYLFVIPAAIFGLFGMLYVITRQQNLNKTSVILTIFLSVVVLVSVSRSDYRTVLSIGLLAINLIVIYQLRPTVSINLINNLFLLAIFVTTFLFFFGYSIYTAIPGLNDHPFHWWRISAYPSASEGGLLAMVILLANLNMKGQRYRTFFLIVAAYMLIFAGNRTAIFGAALGIIYVWLSSHSVMSGNRGRWWFFLLAIFIFTFSIFGSELILQLPFANSSFVREVILRDENLGAGFDAGGQVGTAAIRVWIIEQHFMIFGQNPLFGVGTFNFVEFNSGYGVIDDLTTGSEAFVSALFARIGIVAALLFVALLFTRQPGNQNLALCFRISLAVGMITYGSFVNVYDFVFVLLILGIGGCIQPSRLANPYAVR